MEHKRAHGTFGSHCRRGLSWLRAAAVTAAVACGMLIAPGVAEYAWAAEGDGSDMTINLHDYSRENPDINEGHALKFGSVDGQAGENINAWTGSGGGVYQGIVASTIGENGYPRLADRYGGESLDYLFKSKTEGEARGVTSFDNVTGLFRLDEEGYYVYDSSENYAYYDEGSNSFVRLDYPRYSEYGDNGSIAPSLPQFLPFNSLTRDVSTYDSSGNPLQWRRVNRRYQWGYFDSNGRWHQSDPAATGYDVNDDVNYSFGMDFTKTFYMPKDGQVNGSDMIFDFTGDDDVWVFIDDVLVLDLGGIHDAYNGSINFATGEVTVNATDNGQAIGTENIANIFEAAGEEWDGSDYSTHTIKFYYLERGDGGSNCRIRFNMPTVPDGTIEVGKQVTDTNTADFVNAEFTMKVETADSENGSWSTYVGEYKLFDLDGNPIYDENGVQVTGQTNEDGTFTLKHDQVAQLTGAVQHEGDAEAHKIRANTWYKVTETGADGYSNDYEFDLQNTDLIDDSGDEQTDPSLIGKSKPVRVDRSARMVVRNRFTAKDKYSFSIQKHMEDNSTPDDTFCIKVTDADGNAVTGAQYYVRTIGEGVGETQAMPESGIIELKANQEIVILDVALGATFKVEEVNADGTPFTSDEFKDPKYAVQVGTDKTEPSTEPVTVTIEHSDGDQISYIAHVINAYQVVPVTALPGTIGITKTLNGLALEADMFKFQIDAQATGTGDNAVSAEQAAEKAGLSDTTVTVTNGEETANAGVQSDAFAFLGGMTFTKDDDGLVYEYVISEVGLNENYNGEHKSESEYDFDTTQYRIQFVAEKVQDDESRDVMHLKVYQATRDGSEGQWGENALLGTFDGYDWIADGSAVSSRTLIGEFLVNFTNSYEPLGLVIQKEDESGDPLENAYFTLFVDKDDDGTYDAETDTEVASPVYGTADMTGDTLTKDGFATKLNGDNPDRAIASFYGLKPGTYFIVETKAPAGYQLAEPATLVIGEDRTFTINETSIENVENGVATYTITDLAIAELPTTGSSGTLLMSTAGVATVVVAGCYLALRLKLKR
ncbi:DUF7601 domain-containing protein [Collinsella tanakaei]|uniref:DUF7601 domain-containing protein n=1 Tax=Collinsella tanakaei TaxID=626935 RepID=UPI001F209277|nr:fibro-slime domain-containing protein [Collinsella tanakaei]MCF2621609.1 fibro-slime domain-containing protein [Collinsella tanakaei]